MKTEQILNIDCRKEEGKKKINKYLMRIPDVKERVFHSVEYVSLSILEDVFKYYCTDFNYGTQGIKPYVENGVFVFYNVCVTKRYVNEDCFGNKWIKTVYGIDMWEVFAKMVIAIYADIICNKKSSGA